MGNRQSKGDAMQIRVNIHGETTITLDAKASDTTENLKKRINEAQHSGEQIPPDLQCIIFERKLLKDGKTLSEYGIVKESDLFLIRRLEEKIQIKVKTLAGSGEPILLDVEPHDTVVYMKARIREETRIPVHRQRLQFLQKELEDCKALYEYGLQNKDGLYLISTYTRPDPPQGMHVSVMTWNDEILYIAVDLSEKIEEVKSKIAAREPIPPDQQRLMFSGRQLKDGDTLEEYGIENGSTLYVFDSNLTVEQLRDRLKNDLSHQDRLGLLIYSAVEYAPARSVKPLWDGEEFTEQMLEALHNGLVAIERRDLAKVVSDIQQVHCPRDVRTKCECEGRSFIEYKDPDEKLVFLQCKDEECSAEWLPGLYSSHAGIKMEYHNRKFSKKYPVKFELVRREPENVSDCSQLTPGDHIIFQPKLHMYSHHAIVIGLEGDDMTIIEWTKGEGTTGKVSIVQNTIPFPPNGLGRQSYKEQDPVGITIARALYECKNNQEKYLLLKNNCESFATYCKTGVSISMQAEMWNLLPGVPRFLAKVTGKAIKADPKKIASCTLI